MSIDRERNFNDAALMMWHTFHTAITIFPRGGMGRQINKASEDGKHWSWQLAIDQHRFQGFSRLLLNERTAGKWLISRVLGLEFDAVFRYSNLSI